MSDVPVEIEKLTPATGRVGAPASGTYGEKAEIEQLKKELPGNLPAEPRAQPTPDLGAAPMPPAPAGGLPAGIMAPTRRPDEPASTPLSMPAPLGASTDEQTIQFMHSVATDPNVSQEFREWAQLFLDGAIG